MCFSYKREADYFEIIFYIFNKPAASQSWHVQLFILKNSEVLKGLLAVLLGDWDKNKWIISIRV